MHINRCADDDAEPDLTPDLRQWRYFVAVADERHFGRAAERLSMTQPPLSQAIRALEDALGVALFARTKRSVELTAVGAALLPDVRRLIAAADALPPLAQSLARGEAGSLALAFVSTADYGLLPQLLREFGARYPHVRLQLTEATSDVQIEELVAGRIDAGLVIPPVPPRHAASLSYLPVLREPLVVAMPADAAEARGTRRCASPTSRRCRSSSFRVVWRPAFMTSLRAATARRASRRASARRRSRCRRSSASCPRAWVSRSCRNRCVTCGARASSTARSPIRRPSSKRASCGARTT